MPVRISVGNDFLAGPKNIDAGIDDSTEIAQIGLGRRSEFAREPRIVRIVRGTHDKMRGIAPSANVRDHLRLNVGKSDDVATHVVEQDTEHVYADFVDLLYLRAQQLLSVRVVIQINLKGRQSNSERQTTRLAPPAELP